MSVLLQRARDSGKFPPSLLSDAIVGDGFEEAMLKVMDLNDPMVAGSFASLLQMLTGVDKVAAPTDEAKSSVLAQRRAAVLAVVGNTTATSSSLQKILDAGYLTSVNSWLNDILGGKIGGVDLLLHLLSTIATLPVDKNVVKTSGMGKAIGALEKHKICAGTPNESAIKERSQLIRDSWNSSVKAKKALEAKSSDAAKVGEKRSSPNVAPPIASPEPKRTKTSAPKKAGSPVVNSKPTMSLSALAAKSQATAKATAKVSEIPEDTEQKESTSKKKSSKRVKWEDHFGGDISKSVNIESGESADAIQGSSTETTASWNDRKKRDRLREKELLEKAKKSKLADDDDDDFGMSPRMAATVSWRTPQALPPIPDVTPTVAESPEVENQNRRMQTVPAAQYSSDNDVPSSPAPLNGSEQAHDMTSQSSAVISPIPFFATDPQETPAPAAAAPHFPVAAVPPASTIASPEYVQRLGLPPFLIGRDTRALDTLASSPGLLQTLMDANGMYDQKRLLDLVQTLTPQGSALPTNPGMPTQQHYQPPPVPGVYAVPAPAYGQVQGTFAANPASVSRPSFQSGSEGNLHVSGYGPTTTQAEIIALFSPYVRVEEVVMKGNFSFVNTSDPENANRAKEILHGTLLGGMPIRINPAQRKNRDASSAYGQTPTSSYGVAQTNQYGGGQNGVQQTFGAAPPAYGSTGASQFGAPPAQQPPAPQMQQNGMVMAGAPAANVDSVRDDRGNPATKNLFVAGYGPGTTEQQLRDIFGQYANVIGVILKGTFSFVNTSDRTMAVRAREMLGNTMLNGGALRINFAKESGRLGTSFDVTYNQTSGPNARAPMGTAAPAPINNNYYGRGF